LRFINTKEIDEIKILNLKNIKKILKEEETVDFEKELKREKDILQNIDFIPFVEDEKPLKLFEEFTKRYGLVKWVGRSIYICGIDVIIKPPYDKKSCFGKDHKIIEEIKKILNN
jgi:hypothetical protein